MSLFWALAFWSAACIRTIRCVSAPSRERNPVSIRVCMRSASYPAVAGASGGYTMAIAENYGSGPGGEQRGDTELNPSANYGSEPHRSPDEAESEAT